LDSRNTLENLTLLVYAFPTTFSHGFGAGDNGSVFHVILLFSGHDNGLVEDIINADTLLGRAFHICGTHTFGDSLALLWGNWRQALGSKELNAGFLVAKIGLEATEDDGSGGTEVQNFGIPLNAVSRVGSLGIGLITLSKTFSNELGQSIAKQTKRRSVSG